MGAILISLFIILILGLAYLGYLSTRDAAAKIREKERFERYILPTLPPEERLEYQMKAMRQEMQQSIAALAFLALLTGFFDPDDHDFPF